MSRRRCSNFFYISDDCVCNSHGDRDFSPDEKHRFYSGVLTPEASGAKARKECDPGMAELKLGPPKDGNFQISIYGRNISSMRAPISSWVTNSPPSSWLSPIWHLLTEPRVVVKVVLRELADVYVFFALRCYSRPQFAPLRLQFGFEIRFHKISVGAEIPHVKRKRNDARPKCGRPLQKHPPRNEHDFAEASPSRVLRDGEGSIASGRAGELGLKLRLPDLTPGFRGPEGLLLRKESKETACLSKCWNIRPPRKT